VSDDAPRAPSAWRAAAAVAGRGLESVAIHRARSLATIACVAAVLVPFVAGLALAGGLREQAEDAVRAGADVHVAGSRAGAEVPVPLEAAETLRAIPGVTAVEPRLVGEIRLGREGVRAVLVGFDRRSAGARVVRGREVAPGASYEVVVGTRLARRLALDVGSRIPPFYRNEAGEHVLTVVGVFEPTLPVWEADLVLTSFATASEVLASKGLASSLLLSVAPGYADPVRDAVSRIASLGPDDGRGAIRPVATTRGELEARLARGLVRRDGVFALHFVLALAAAIPVVLVTSGIGLAERRREVGLLRALGWQTEQVVLATLVESLAIALAAASASILAAWAWLRAFGGAGLGAVFLPGLDAAHDVDLPWALAPTPVAAAFAIPLAVVGVGSLLSSWRSASAAPLEAMR
jgi:ABC-type lipoprotein release transport system permease subunit